ncbi:hypothetical protein C3495_14165 (plasmid) [Clostridiaceae bacterium 14S0207]|nr:hypothetical protein C3495_14165 [Clostridiaceae bacterium 14S0207]
MKTIEKIILIYFLIIITGGCMDGIIDKLNMPYVFQVFSQTIAVFLQIIIIIKLIKVFRLNKKGIFILFGLSIIFMLLLSFDIESFLSYRDIGLWGTIYPENINLFLELANLPLVSLFEIIKQYGILKFKFFIIPIYTFIVMMIALNREHRKA